MTSSGSMDERVEGARSDIAGVAVASISGLETRMNMKRPSNEVMNSRKTSKSASMAIDASSSATMVDALNLTSSFALAVHQASACGGRARCK